MRLRAKWEAACWLLWFFGVIIACSVKDELFTTICLTVGAMLGLYCFFENILYAYEEKKSNEGDEHDNKTGE